jgi:2-phosphosulfolactate phosphatase
VQLHVALTPADIAPCRLQIVVDCIRATSTIAQALAAGYDEVVCVAEIADARALRAAGTVLGGERMGVRIDGFDLGNSPAEYVDPRGRRLVLTTTNGTKAILQAAGEADVVLVGALTCLAAVAEAAVAGAGGGDIAVRCAGVYGELALDDAYVAGRLVERIAATVGAAHLTDAARAAVAIASAYPDAISALRASQSARHLAGTGHEEDVVRCAAESTLDVAPRVSEHGAGRATVVSPAAG